MGEFLAVSRELHCFDDEWGLGQLLQDLPVLDEVHDVGQAEEGLLNDELVLFSFVLPRLDIFRRVLMIEG